MNINPTKYVPAVREYLETGTADKVIEAIAVQKKRGRPMEKRLEKDPSFNEMECLTDICAAMDRAIGQDERTIIRILSYLMARYIGLTRTVYISNKSAYTPPNGANSEHH